MASSPITSANAAAAAVEEETEDGVSVRQLEALDARAAAVLEEMAAAQHAFTADANDRTHGALALSVAKAHRVLRALDLLRWRQDQPGGAPGAGLPPRWRVACGRRRTELRRALPRAAALLEDVDRGGGGGADEAAAALRSLVHTRSLLSVELQKVDAVVKGVAGGAESMTALRGALVETQGAMHAARAAVRQLLDVQSRDDLVLTITTVVFALTIALIVLHRLFGFFPVATYVSLSSVQQERRPQMASQPTDLPPPPAAAAAPPPPPPSPPVAAAAPADPSDLITVPRDLFDL